MIQKFDIRDFSMYNVELLKEQPDGSSAEKYHAERALWLGGRWWFMNITIRHYNENGDPVGAPELILQKEMTEVTETPSDILYEMNPKRAKQNDAIAQLTMGLFYCRGYYGLPQDYKEAAKYFYRAASNGNERANREFVRTCLILANRHLDGIGAIKNVRDGYAWALLAAQSGNFELGDLSDKLSPRLIASAEKKSKQLMKEISTAAFRDIDSEPAVRP